MTRAWARPHWGLAVFHLLVSIVLLAAAIALGTWAWGQGYWPLAAIAVAGVFGGQGRLFGVQHDCGHLSYFPSNAANIACGVLLSGITYNPFFAMRYNHNQHHAFTGDLDRMEAHEVLTWTVAQWSAASPARRLFYRAYRSWPVILVIGPIFVLFLRYRFPKNALKIRHGLLDAAAQNALMVAFFAAIWALGGWPALQFYAVAALISACFAVFVVYVGHNHEHTYWNTDPDYDFEEASLKGSSVVDFGPVFDFLSFNFAYHDLHHLNVRIPAYRLKACHQALSPHLDPTRLSFIEATRCLRWKLWDEDRGRMVTFRDAAQGAPALTPAE